MTPIDPLTTEMTSCPDVPVSVATFRVGQAFFGIDILRIREINRQAEMTLVPLSDKDILGILNLRGTIVTIIDLGLRLGLGPVTPSRETRTIIVTSEGESIGLLVDAIGDVADGRKLEPVPATLKGIKARYFQGVLKRSDQLIGILDLDQLL